MLEKKNEHAFDLSLHGGLGRMTIEHHFAGITRLPVAVQTWVLEPGATEGMHTHDEPELEELYIVVSGTAEINQEGVKYQLNQGDSFLSPVGAEHDLVNPSSEEPLVIVIVWGPPGDFDFTRFESYRKGMATRGETVRS